MTEPVEVDPPYLKGEDSVTLDFTGVIGISGRHRRDGVLHLLRRATDRFGKGINDPPVSCDLRPEE